MLKNYYVLEKDYETEVYETETAALEALDNYGKSVDLNQCCYRVYEIALDGNPYDFEPGELKEHMTRMIKE